MALICIRVLKQKKCRQELSVKNTIMEFYHFISIFIMYITRQPNTNLLLLFLVLLLGVSLFLLVISLLLIDLFVITHDFYL